MPTILPPAGKDIVVCGFSQTVSGSRSTLLVVLREQIAVVVMTNAVGCLKTPGRVAGMLL